MAKERRRTTLPISKERINELFDYNRETGEFIWRVARRGGAGVGQRAGSIDDTKHGYRWIRIDQVDYLAHRLVWFLEYGKWPKGIIRFRDGNRQNCAISNLRDASYVEQGKFDWRTKEGRAAQQKAYRATITDRMRDERLQEKFGISLEKYNQMHAAQDGKCAICGNPEQIKRNGKVRWLAVDHCHKRDKVRDLLCGNCNPMIGYAKDSIEILEKAIAYLRKHESGI